MKTEGIIGLGALGVLGYIIYVNNKPDKVEFQRVGDEAVYVPEDLNQDGAVTTQDLLIQLSRFGEVCPETQSECLGDLNDDSAVGVQDILILLAKFGYTENQAMEWVQTHIVNCDYSTEACIT